jgi:hypothetical protein
VVSNVHRTFFFSFMPVFICAIRSYTREKTSRFVVCGVFAAVASEDMEDFVHVIVNCKVCKLGKQLSLLVVTIYKGPRNPVINSNLISSH